VNQLIPSIHKGQFALQFFFFFHKAGDLRRKEIHEKGEGFRLRNVVLNMGWDFKK